jgi:hypothetical protein
VDVLVGGGVSDATTVTVAVAVEMDNVGVSVTGAVGVSVRGALEGRLQADRARTIARANQKLRLRNLITLLLCVAIILCRNLAEGNG